jgi:hypothetical protein
MGWNPANWSIIDQLQGQEAGALNPNNLTSAFTGASGNARPTSTSSGTNVLGARTSTPSTGGLFNEDNQPFVGGTGLSDEPYNLGVDTQAQQRATETSDALRAYNDRENALRGLLGRVGATRTQGFNKIGDEYNANKTSGLAGYDEQRTLNTKDKLSNVDRINQKAQSGYNSLRRILGMSGSANQSAKLGIGQAVSKVASQDRAGAFDTAGRNESGIELAQNTFLNDLNRRKADAEYNFEQDILGQENDIYGDLASVAGQRAQIQGGNYDAIRAAQDPYQAEISNRDNILASLFEKYRPTLNTVAERPELGKFSVDRAAVQANQQQPGDFSPYSQVLRRRLTEGA